MSYDKWKRGCQHLDGGHQRITYKKRLIITLRLTQNNQRVVVDHAVRIHSLSFPLMPSSVDKNKKNFIIINDIYPD